MKVAKAIVIESWILKTSVQKSAFQTSVMINKNNIL